MDLSIFLIPGLIFGGAALISSLRVLIEYQRGVVFRLGKVTRAKGPGLIFLVPFGIERMRKIDLRIVAMDIPPQDTITKDNVSVKVNAVVYFRVHDPEKAVIAIEDYHFATSQMAQTTLRSVIGQSELDEILAERDHVNEVVRNLMDEATDAWGIDVVGVEVKDIDLPKEMKRAMAKQAEAERERRGKVIAAEGEFQAAGKLAKAAEMMEAFPIAIQLRFLQTVTEIAAENNSTTVFPIPMDLFRPIIEAGMKADDAAKRAALLSAHEEPALPGTASRAVLEEAARAFLGVPAGAASDDPQTETPVATENEEEEGA